MLLYLSKRWQDPIFQLGVTGGRVGIEKNWDRKMWSWQQSWGGWNWRELGSWPPVEWGEGESWVSRVSHTRTVTGLGGSWREPVHCRPWHFREVSSANFRPGQCMGHYRSLIGVAGDLCDLLSLKCWGLEAWRWEGSEKSSKIRGRRETRLKDISCPSPKLQVHGPSSWGLGGLL